MAARRLFIGLMAGRAQEAITRYQLQYDWPVTVRLTAPSQLHLTLLFLGNVELDVERRLSAALATVPMAPLSLRLTRADMFPGGIAVLKPGENRSLELLQGDIAALVQHGGSEAINAASLPRAGAVQSLPSRSRRALQKRSWRDQRQRTECSWLPLPNELMRLRTSHRGTLLPVAGTRLVRDRKASSTR